MTSSPQLALAYIEKSPASASRVLSSLPVAAAAAFIEEIPVDPAVQLAAHLQPAIAAKILCAVDDKAVAAIFRDLDFSKASAIVRQMDWVTRKEFFSKLSERTRAMLEKSLSFAPDTVGAHMTTTIVTLTESESVATALDAMRHSKQNHTDLVFVLNAGGSLSGIVSSAVALRHSPATKLSEILDTSCPQISAHSKLEAIADPALWHDFPYLPIVNRRDEVIGAISRRALKAGRTAPGRRANPGSQSIPLSILEMLAVTTKGLLGLVAKSDADATGQGDRGEN